MRLIKMIGLLFIALSIFVFAQRIFFIKHSQKITGTVISLNEISRTDIQAIGKGARVTTITYPSVEFFIDNHKYIINSSIVASYLKLHSDQYEINQSVEIFYNPTNPKSALINNAIELWTLPCLLLGLGFSFLILIPLMVNLIFRLSSKSNNYKM